MAAAVAVAGSREGVAALGGVGEGGLRWRSPVGGGTGDVVRGGRGVRAAGRTSGAGGRCCSGVGRGRCCCCAGTGRCLPSGG